MSRPPAISFTEGTSFKRNIDKIIPYKGSKLEIIPAVWVFISFRLFIKSVWVIPVNTVPKVSTKKYLFW